MRTLKRLLAVLMLVVVAGMVLLGVTAPWSPWGWLELSIVSLVSLCLLMTRSRARRVLGIIAVALLVLLLGLRLVGGATGNIRMLTFPQGTSSRWLGRLLDEQEVSLMGARLLATQWHLPRVEREGLLPALGAAYAEMRRDDAISPSPVLNTLLGRQKPDAFDTLIIAPPTPRRPEAAVIFLHGYTGSFTLECWLLAAAAREINATTVCPATGFAGHWRGRNAERILGATLKHLRSRGLRRVFLAGLSNGAVGAAAMTPRFASSLAGIILISGAPSSGGSAGLPVLVLQGRDDPLVRSNVVRSFAARTRGTYVSFDAGHFVLLVRRAEARQTIARWLRRQQARR